MFTNIFLIIIGIAVLVLIYFVGSAISLWIQALVSGARVSLIAIVFMRFRKVPRALAVTLKKRSEKRRVGKESKDLESPYQ